MPLATLADEARRDAITREAVRLSYVFLGVLHYILLRYDGAQHRQMRVWAVLIMLLASCTTLSLRLGDAKLVCIPLLNVCIPFAVGHAIAEQLRTDAAQRLAGIERFSEPVPAIGQTPRTADTVKGGDDIVTGCSVSRQRHKQPATSLHGQHEGAAPAGTLAKHGIRGQTRINMGPSEWARFALRLDLFSWELDLYSPHGGEGVAVEELLSMAHRLFGRVLQRVELDLRVGIMDDARLKTFLVSVCEGYQRLPFHSFLHAVYVLHGCVLITEQSETIRSLLRPLDEVAMCVAALGHDLGHPGVNNTFLVNAGDPLALQYNDLNVLENMHASRLALLLQSPKGGALFDGLTVLEFKAVRKLIISSILGTDLVNVSVTIDRFHAWRDRLASDPTPIIRGRRSTPWCDDDPEDRLMVVGLILSAADLSGPIRPWGVSSVWAQKLQQEFVAQVEMEKQLDLPPSTFLVGPKQQLERSFIDNFARPTWKAIVELASSAAIDKLLAELEKNYALWSSWGE